MPTRIQTNYLFNGNGFLDSRQGKASNLRDLKNWDFKENVLPIGFEVCVGGNWYTYDPTFYSDKTGKFKPRTSLSGGGNAGTGENTGTIYEGEIVGEV